MAFELRLSDALKAQGWKVKIRDRERLEPPHLSVLHKTQVWRVSLRTREFLDTGKSWSGMPAELEETIRSNWWLLRSVWDEMYPKNPIDSGEHNRDG